MKEAFEKIADQGAVIAKETWEVYRRRSQPVIDENQLSQARQQHSFKELADHLETEYKSVVRLAKKYPQNKETLDSIEDAWKKIRQMQSEN